MSAPKVLGLNGIGLEVPDVEVARKFYTTFGLQGEMRGETLMLRSPGRKNEEIVVVKGGTKRLNHISFYIDPATQGAFADHLRKTGMKVQDTPPAGGAREGLWCQDPWGTWFHLHAALPGPVAIVPVPTYNFGGRADRVDVHLWNTLPQNSPLMRIGHMLLFTQDFEKAEQFLIDSLGLRTADRAAGKVAFMAAGSGLIDHHCFGLVNSTHRGFQHASFQVATVDDIGFGAWRMFNAGYKESFGLGRHALASNLFHYIRDPWGSWVELYADMDKITDTWVSRDWNQLPYIWGPGWSPEFWGKEMNGNFEPK